VLRCSRPNIVSQLGNADGVISDFPLSGPIATFSNEIAVGDTNSPVNGSATVQVGSSLKSVKARASVSGGSASLFTASALVQTEYHDTFVMNAVDVNGSPVLAGTFVANAVLSGEATANGTGFFSAFSSAAGGMFLNRNGALGDSFRIVATASGAGVNSPRRADSG